jgi:lipoprotein-releasing system permease protein
MSSAFELTVAWRYLRARRGERFVSFIAMFSLTGIALGVATLIVVLSVMGGFQRELLTRILGLNGEIGLYPAPGATVQQPEALAQRLRALPAVAGATPILEGQVLLASDAGESVGALVRGIAPEEARARPLLANGIRAGSLADFQGEDAMLVGRLMAEKLGLKPGDRITMISPQGRQTVFGTVPRLRSYRVAAVFEIGMQEYDAGFAYLPLPAAQIFFQLPRQATQIEVTLHDPGSAARAVWPIQEALQGMPLRVIDWQQANAGYFATVQVQRNVMFLILALIVLVAAFNIVSTLIMMVKDKGRDIAVLRTMGATRGAVLRIFVAVGAALGVLGTLLGLGLGLLFCAHIESIRQVLMRLTGTRLFDPGVYLLTQIPAVVDPMEVAQVVAMGLGLALLATLWPSWRAARQDPVEALRNE